MAVFLQSNKSAIVWNKKSNKPLFTFIRRRLETIDPKLIGLLTKMGYIREDSVDEEDEINNKEEIVETPAGNVKGASTAGKRVRLGRDLKD